MNIFKFILKAVYLKFTTSQISSIGHDDLVERVKQQLNDENYNIISSTDEKIVFNGFGNKSKLISVTQYSKKIEMGVLYLNNTEDGVVVKLTYFINILSEMITMTILFIISLFTSFLVLLIGIILCIRIFIKINDLKHVSRKFIIDLVK
ncbi:MAG: hypothetical protein JWP94_474 [Mucilaginibacter sp.]|nr:hypothetical protein [Mucilaginibacter sp.]